ncbi:MAG TPA: galactokinase [Ktedonobacterales bacterium]
MTDSPLPPAASAALAAHRHIYGGDARVAWAPGRINIIGEHTDYNEGWVLPAAVKRHVAVAGTVIAGSVTDCFSEHHAMRASFTNPSSPEHALPAYLPLWSRYIWAIFAELAALGVRVPTSRLAISGDLPVGGGMSSSAALLTATATFLTRTAGHPIEPLALAQLCQRAERLASGAQVGIMDQAIALLGQEGLALLLDCRDLSHEWIHGQPTGWQWLLFDTQVRHSTAAGEYNLRRAQCEAAVVKLQAALPDQRITALRDVSLADLDAPGAGLSVVERARARHVITENGRVHRMVAAMRADDTHEIGHLLVASHASLRDDFAVSIEELDVAVEVATAQTGVAGARMMGAGFGGSVLILARADDVNAISAAITSAYEQRTGRPGKAHVEHIGDGARFR